MRIDSIQQFTFPIKVTGEASLLQITIFMEETEFPQVTFSTDPALAESIGREMVRFYAKFGM